MYIDNFAMYKNDTVYNPIYYAYSNLLPTVGMPNLLTTLGITKTSPNISLKTQRDFFHNLYKLAFKNHYKVPV